VVSILLESGSLWGCVREINLLRGKRTMWVWLKEARSAELVVVFGEDLGALLGLILALVFLCTAVITGDGRFDAYGSMAIGAVLLVIAAFVAVRIHALLLGRSADPELQGAIEEVIAEDEDIEQIYNVITIQMGPQIMLAAKVRMTPGITCTAACKAVNALERELKSRFPEIRWSFIEQDVTD
jgi:divalent metal cation (Fe/Co/Zn/Cd) transporter